MKPPEVTDAHSPLPVSENEQSQLFKELSSNFARTAIFKVNASCHDYETGSLRREEEIDVCEYDLGYFDNESGRVEPGPNPFAPDKVLTMCPK